MGNWLSSPAADKKKEETCKKRAREEPVSSCGLHMVPPKRARTLFRFTYKDVPFRSGRLNTTTMTIVTDDGAKYQTAYRYVGNHRMEPWAQADLDAMDFETITYQVVERCSRDDHVYFYFEVMCRGVRESVYVRRVTA